MSNSSTLRKFIMAFGFVSLCLLGHPTKAFTVYDPANHAQNLQTAIRMLTQIQHTRQQLMYQRRMVQQLKNGGDLNSLMKAMNIADNTARYLLEQTSGLNQLVEKFDIVFPEQGDWSQKTKQQDQLRNSAHRSLETQKQTLQNSILIRDTLRSIAAKSQNAVGQLQALQAGNQTSVAQGQLLASILQSVSADAERAATVTAKEDARHRRALQWKAQTLQGLKNAKSSGEKKYDENEWKNENPFEKRVLP